MSIHKRGNIWYAYIRDPQTGRQITKSLKTTSQREAKRLHALMLVEMGKHGAEAVRGKLTFADLMDKYLEWSRANKKSYRRDLTSAKALLAKFRGVKLGAITPLMIEQYKAERSGDGLTNSSINRELALLKHAFNQASRWGLYHGANPMKGVTMLRENPPRLRYLTPDEFKRLHDAAPAHLQPILLMLVSTGLRLGEALGLTWEAVDLENGMLHVADSKAGRPRDVPLPSQLRAVLADIKGRSQGPAVFTYRGKSLSDVRSGFARACRSAGIENFRLHDLRHTFASWQAMAGTPIRTLQELLGHRTITMTMRYAHLMPGHIQAAAKVIEGLLKT